MLRFKFMSQVLAAGVVQFASTFGPGSVTAAFAEPLVFAQGVCAPVDEVSGNPDDADAEGWACGEDLPDLDLTVPANGAAALSNTGKDKQAKLPDEAAAAAPLPLEISPSEAGASARASLQTLRSFQNQKQARKVQEATTSSGGTLAVPKPAAMPPGPLDLWTRLDAQGFDATDSRSVKSGAGLDYRVVKNASIGVAAERAETLAASHASGGTAEDKVSAYVAFRALPALTIDARGNWSNTQASDPVAMAAGEKASVAVAPRFAKSYALDGGETLVPYVEVKHEIDLSGSALGAQMPGAANSAAAGVTLARPNSYSVSVSADVTSTDPKEAPSLSSKVQLKLPLD